MEVDFDAQVARSFNSGNSYSQITSNITENLSHFASQIARYTQPISLLNVDKPTAAEDTVTTATRLTRLAQSLPEETSVASFYINETTAYARLAASGLAAVGQQFAEATTMTHKATMPAFLADSTTTSSLRNLAIKAAGNLVANAAEFVASNVTATATATTQTLFDLPNATEDSFDYIDSDFHSDNSSSLNISNSGTSNWEHAPQLTKSAMVKVYVLSVMAIVSLFGNILTMWNIYKTRIARRNSRHSWSAIYSLIFHLSIADVLVTGFCIIGEAAWCYTVQWLADELTCKLVKLFQMFSLYLSTYVLVLIGVDRWIAVKYPMKSLNMAKRCYRLLGGTYIFSLLLSLPQFFIFHIARGPFVEEFYQCVTHGFYTAEWQEQLYATFTLVFTFLLPLVILFGTYLSSFRTIASSEKMFQVSKLATYTTKPATQTNRQRLIHKAKMKSLRISVVIIFAFVICWTPYYVMMVIFMFWNPDKRFAEDLQAAIFFFGMSNSLVNPLIYGAFHLCPMKRKTSKYSHNNAHSLNRGDSQRTPSLLTAVTQVDSHGRQVRTYRPSYYRTQSSCSSNNYKEHVSLLQVTPTPTAIRKNLNSLRSNGNGSISGLGQLGAGCSQATAVLLSYDVGKKTGNGGGNLSSVATTDDMAFSGGKGHFSSSSMSRNNSDSLSSSEEKYSSGFENGGRNTGLFHHHQHHHHHHHHLPFTHISMVNSGRSSGGGYTGCGIGTGVYCNSNSGNGNIEGGIKEANDKISSV